MGFESQRKISVAESGSLAIASSINHLVGTAVTALVNPGGAQHLVMINESVVAANSFRARLGDFVPTTFVTDDLGLNTLTVTAHPYETGDRIDEVSSTTTLPAGLAASTPYWIINVDANTIAFADSLANALAGTSVDITDAGTGTHTINPGGVAGGVAIPASSEAGGLGSLEIPQASKIVLPAPNRITLEGSAAGSVLTYYWV